MPFYRQMLRSVDPKIEIPSTWDANFVVFKNNKKHITDIYRFQVEVFVLLCTCNN